MRHIIFILFYPNGQRGGELPDFLVCSFPCSADHELDWPPCKVVFRVGNQYAECEKQPPATKKTTNVGVILVAKTEDK